MRVMKLSGGLVILSFVALAQPPATRDLLNRYCLGCHNDKTKMAGISVSALPIEDNLALWEKVAKKLTFRQMPPPGAPHPSETAYGRALNEILEILDKESSGKSDPGRPGSFRRLNRFEYHNSVRDILGVDYDVSALLPADESSHGFDNISVESLSPTLLERYLTAAQKISRLAVGSPIKKPAADVILIPPDLTQEEHQSGLPFGTRGGAVSTYHFPVDGTYELQVRLSRDRNERVEGLDTVHRVELSLDGKRLGLFTITPPPRGSDHQDVDAHVKAKLNIPAGPHQIGVAFPQKTGALLETERQPYSAHFNMDRHPRVQPALYSISILGPYDAGGPGNSPSRRRIFVCNPSATQQEAACAATILSTVLRRAYRRPIASADLEMPLKFYRLGRGEGSFDRGIELAIRAILVNPQFLFRIEKDPAGIAPKTAYSLSDLELATRLSFFLWSSVPDDALLELAERKQLHQKANLEQQVRRMLADPKAGALVSNFASQWLYLRNLASTTPDPRLFPDFDENLRQAMREETEQFFASVLRDDSSVLTLLSAGYTFLNERLARHYGIPNIYGSRFRRVSLDGSGIRGGLLNQASILTVTSYATRTSPVIRGKWILSNIIGIPPNPPPPVVPQLKDAGATKNGKLLSMRERVAEHRANPACASCHNMMDPVGFAFENYDAVGRWRTTDNGLPVDASGVLPDGTKFQNAGELRQYLLSHPDWFASTLAEKLLVYGLGRGIEYYDAASIRKIVRAAAKQDYRFSALITGIVSSTPFTSRRSQ